jgi:hypothetical protein
LAFRRLSETPCGYATNEIIGTSNEMYLSVVIVKDENTGTKNQKGFS